jgi:hypothetical protein
VYEAPDFFVSICQSSDGVLPCAYWRIAMDIEKLIIAALCGVCVLYLKSILKEIKTNTTMTYSLHSKFVKFEAICQMRHKDAA